MIEPGVATRSSASGPPGSPAAEDLGSASAIGITCMLSIIAFQLAQADTLPRVPYLTIADRIYTICYVLISVALGDVIPPPPATKPAGEP